MTNRPTLPIYWSRSLLISLAVVGASLCLLFVLGSLRVGAAEPRTPGNPTPFPDFNNPAVPLTASVGIGYDEPLDPATVTTRTFVVQAMQSGQLLATYGVHGGQIFLTPTTPFRPGELVMASATTGTLSAIDGTGPLTPTVWLFQAAAPAGAGQFLASEFELGINRTANLALGDVDGDNDLDIVLSNNNTPSEVWLNEPDPVTGQPGAFILAQNLGNYDNWDVDLGDVDSDGDLDIFFGNRNSPNALWVNLGGMQGGPPGVFTDSNQFLADNATTGAALGDLDGDGDLDAFLIDSDGNGNQVWLNSGGLQGGVTGVFTDSGQLLGNQNGRDVALGDVDNDGDLDAVTSVWNGRDRVWLNNGKAIFVDSGQILGNDRATSIALGDVDHDGDLDIFVGRDTGREDELWLNQGGLQGGTTGIFALSNSQFLAISTRRVTMGDVDGDLDLDLMATGRLGAPNIIWLNDGTGQFSITNTVQIEDMADSYAIAAGDINNDDDLDLIIGYNFNAAPNRIWRNNSAPQIMATNLPATIDEGTTITMSVMISSTDSPAELLNLQVSWGDGTTTTLDFPAGDSVLFLPHFYANNRPDGEPHTIQLSVTDPEGGEDQATAMILVNNVPPSLTHWLLTPHLQEGETAFLNGEMYDPGSDALVLSLNWGEGQQEVHHFPAGTTTFSLTHTYLDDNPSGTPSDPYTVSMILLDQDLGLDLDEDTLIVQNQDPIADAGPNQTVELGQSVQLTGAYDDAGVEDTHVIWWDMGDGTTISNTLTFTYTYAISGQFTVTFHVLDDDTGLATSTLRVTVQQPNFSLYLPLAFNEPD